MNPQETAASTKVDLVYTQLRERILQGECQPGERLVIRRIAQELGVSDIPVREALRLLAKDGLVLYTPYGGAEVKGLTEVEIYEVFFVRALLEAVITQLSVSYISDITLRKLEALAADMEACSREHDMSGYARLNREFHETIFSIVPTKNLAYVLENLWHSNAWSQMTFYLNPERMTQSNAEHREILSALQRRNVADAGRAAFHHKQSARKSFIATRHGNGPAPPEEPRDAALVETLERLSEFWERIKWPEPDFTAPSNPGR